MGAVWDTQRLQSSEQPGEKGWGHLGGQAPQEGSSPLSCLELGDQTGFLRDLSSLAWKGSKDGDWDPALWISFCCFVE